MPVAEITVHDSDMAHGSPYGVVDDAFYQMAQPDRTSTRASFELDDAQFGGPVTLVITGTDLTYTANGRLTGGTITGAARLDASGLPMLTMTGRDGGFLQIDVAEVRASGSPSRGYSAYFADWSVDLDASAAEARSWDPGGGGFNVSGAWLNLSRGSDQAVGSTQDDFIVGWGGDDAIAGGSGGDYLFGGSGDTFEGVEDPTGWGGVDTLSGEAGNDVLYGGARGDTLYGGIGNDGLYGGHGADALRGGTGDDWVWNIGGGDRADGGTGADTLAFATRWDLDEPDRTLVVDLGAQTVRIDGQPQGRVVKSFENVWVGDDFAGTVKGSAGANFLYGGEAGDSLTGNGGKDVLRGGRGDDTLTGGWGDDTLEGEWGLDALSGGTGRDTFVFDTRWSPTPDVLDDFRSGEDVIRVVINADGPGSTTPIDPDLFKDLSRGPADADDLVLYDPDTGALYFVRDGEPEVIASLGLGTALVASDVEIAFI